MATLLLRLCGPMQSWGTRSRFTERDTEMEPSKSGVIGLVCAALGRPRDQDVGDLAALKMGVRVDHEGRLARDYHTAGAMGRDKRGGIIRASGKLSDDAVLSNRYYLQDADFLVGLEGEDRELLETIEAALKAPTWPLSLGRKSFLPAVPVHMPGSGLREAPLREALEREPWPLPWSPRRRGEEVRPLRLVLEVSLDDPRALVRNDQPIGAAFALRERRFGPRAIRHEFFDTEENHVPQPA